MRDADVVITMVPDSPDVEAVASGEDGIYARAKPGTLHIDMSSIRPDVARAGRARPAGSAASASSTPRSAAARPGAIDATLSIMVGGDPADFDDARPVLEAVGKTVVHVGPAGSGQTVKAANQLIVAGTIELRGRGDRLPRGLRRRHRGGARGAGRWPGRQRRPGPQGGGHAATGDFTPGVPDRPAPQGHGHRHRRPPARPGWSSRWVRVVAQLVASLQAQGDGGLDHSALLLLVEQLSGRS